MIVLGPEGWPCKREREPSSQEGCARPVQKQRDRCASLTALRVGCVCSARKEARTAINKTASCTCGPWLPPSSSPATKLAPEERRRPPARRTTAKPTPLLPLCSLLSLSLPLTLLQRESAFFARDAMRLGIRELVTSAGMGACGHRCMHSRSSSDRLLLLLLLINN